ncbi:MAG TPA: TetR/AcrR family transcriptional regulator [Terriglobia bacterium]|nr:TetR/AcrR family transcriptional regulator [Terriglobia bacterium]
MKHDRRQDILRAAMELFAKNGFRGTTTRDLATQAGVNEAIIFRHFNTKEELYSAILECKAGENRNALIEEIERLSTGTDDAKFFESAFTKFLEKHEHDTTFLRLLLFSALEGHQLSEMFVSTLAPRNPIAGYIQRRIDEGAFRPVNAELATRALFGMFFSFVLTQEVLGFKKIKSHDREEVVRTFVSLFLSGISKE